VENNGAEVECEEGVEVSPLLLTPPLLLLLPVTLFLVLYAAGWRTTGQWWSVKKAWRSPHLLATQERA
jgi:hypothetical protein